jgi:DNA-binding FadR family transcriptional regulator
MNVPGRPSDPTDLEATSTEEHSKVVDELVEGDGERAAAAMLKHLEYGKQFLISR